MRCNKNDAVKDKKMVDKNEEGYEKDNAKDNDYHVHCLLNIQFPLFLFY